MKLIEAMEKLKNSIIIAEAVKSREVHLSLEAAKTICNILDILYDNRPQEKEKPAIQDKILEWYRNAQESEEDEYIYAYMYLCGKRRRGDKIIKIHKSELSLTANKDAFIYVWGYPGPDYNVYKFSKYGIDWTFTREELKK